MLNDDDDSTNLIEKEDNSTHFRVAFVHNNLPATLIMDDDEIRILDNNRRELHRISYYKIKAWACKSKVEWHILYFDHEHDNLKIKLKGQSPQLLSATILRYVNAIVHLRDREWERD